MCVKSQEETLAPFTVLWYRASPNGLVDVYPLRGAVIGPLTDAVMETVNEADVLLVVMATPWLTDT